MPKALIALLAEEDIVCTLLEERGILIQRQRSTHKPEEIWITLLPDDIPMKKVRSPEQIEPYLTTRLLDYIPGSAIWNGPDDKTFEKFAYAIVLRWDKYRRSYGKDYQGPHPGFITSNFDDLPLE